MTGQTPPLVVHVIHRLTTGGLENGLVNLINKMPVNSYRHTIVCMTDYNEFIQRIQRDDVEVYALNKAEGKDLGVYLRLWRLLRQLKPDIVHTRNLSALEASVIAALASVKYRVHGEHGRDIHDMDGTNKKYNMLRRFCQHFVHRYITVSKDLQNWLVNTVGIPPNKVVQIYNGVYSEKFSVSLARENLPKEGFSNSNTIIVGTVGRLETVKDQTNLVSAFIELHKAYPDLARNVRLVIVGEGALRSDIEKMSSENHLQADVWLAGNRDDVPQLMQGMDIFVLPSLAEGISNTILEAMATGLPVIATNVGGNPELVIEGETGHLVPSANPEKMAEAIKYYLEQPNQIEKHGRASRRRIEDIFGMDAMVNEYLKVYDELIGRPE